MAPRKGTRQDRGAGQASERAAGLEAAISQITGVASVRVSCGPAGEVTGIDILMEKGVQSRRVVRDVESACAAYLGHRLSSESVTVARAGRGAAKRSKRNGPALGQREAGAAEAMGAPAGQGAEHVRGGDDDAPPASARDRGRAPRDVSSEGRGSEAPVVKRYRVVSRAGRGASGGEKPAKASRARSSGEEEIRPDPRIGVRRMGVNVYPNRIHAMVELSYGPRTFVGEDEDLPGDDSRFRVPATATLKALDQAFGGLVGLSVDDIQVCRLSGRETAVVLATVGSPWGDVPSTGASYVTRSEEEAVIRALLHAVNRCVTLTYGGEEYYEEDYLA